MIAHARFGRLLAAGSLTATIPLAGTAEVAFSGGDSFSDNVKDPGLWGPATGSSDGTLRIALDLIAWRRGRGC